MNWIHTDPVQEQISGLRSAVRRLEARQVVHARQAALDRQYGRGLLTEQEYARLEVAMLRFDELAEQTLAERDALWRRLAGDGVSGGG